MVLCCAVKDLGVKTIISSPIEHHAVIHALEALNKIHKVNVDYIILIMMVQLILGI